jgi:acetate kinase
MPNRQGLILAVNAGSSSLKISLFKPSPSTSDSDSRAADLILESSIDGLSSPPARFTLTHADPAARSKDVKKEQRDTVHDHASAFACFLDHLERGAGIAKSDVAHVCHRVVHGGDYTDPVVISQETYHHIEKLTDLAPLYAALCTLLPLMLMTPTPTIQTQRRRARRDQRLPRRAPARELDRLLRHDLPPRAARARRGLRD